MNPDNEQTDYMNTVLGLLDLGQSFDEIDALLSDIDSGYKDALWELMDIREDLEVVEDKPSGRYIDYKAGWYQDLKGNLYKYDGVVWDVVPGRDTKVEFLG
jgi:hypothetical protein